MIGRFFVVGAFVWGLWKGCALGNAIHLPSAPTVQRGRLFDFLAAAGICVVVAAVVVWGIDRSKPQGGSRSSTVPSSTETFTFDVTDPIRPEGFTGAILNLPTDETRKAEYERYMKREGNN